MEKSNCEEGYHLIINGSKQYCVSGFIENCKVYDPEIKECLTCEDGFLLLSDYTCSWIPGCLRLGKVCLECESNYILLNGNCMSIPNCIK